MNVGRVRAILRQHPKSTADTFVVSVRHAFRISAFHREFVIQMLDFVLYDMRISPKSGRGFRCFLVIHVFI
jgi:hypothetical protein